MRRILMRTAALCLAALVMTSITWASSVAHAQPARELSANVSIFATGLDRPRGLKFGPDGSLYVAEAGQGGALTATCPPEPPPFGPFRGGASARISKISLSGVRSVVAEGLPSYLDAFGDAYGVADIAFDGTTLYALIDGGGCQRGFPDFPPSVIRLNADGTWAIIADLSAFVQANPVAQLPKNVAEGGDLEEVGVYYGLIAARGMLFVVEANHGQILSVTTGGTITRFFDMSAGHPVPTVLAYHEGNFYVGNLGGFPIARGTQQVMQITPTGRSSVFAAGLTAILGIAFDQQGRLYVLETSTVDRDVPQAGAGRVVRMSSSGVMEDVATGLSFPTGMTFGPDGMLYVSHLGYGSEPGKGEVVRINVQTTPSPAPSPPAPAPAPAIPLPNTGVEGEAAMFPETGYSLDGEFLRYWRENGGLPVFGMPIDSARQPDGQVSQWLERARFELHPEHAAPYRVLLSRLGADALAEQGRDWQSFAKASPSAPHYFEATGHAIAYDPFWSYWASHGLEFDGRAGSSYAESLALFGYPISEATMERNASGALVLTQWFERARFEYHPDNPAAYRVLLGRLGAEVRAVQKR